MKVNEKNVVININVGNNCESENPLIQESDTVFTDLVSEIIEKINTNQITAKNFSDFELRQLAVDFANEFTSFEETKECLENYYSLSSQQLGLFYKYLREANITLFSESLFDARELESKLPKIDAATEIIIRKCQEKYGKPFQIVAGSGAEGLDEIIDQAFNDVSSGNFMTLRGNCPQETYPYYFPMGFTIWILNGWKVTTRKRRDAEGCNYHQYGFKKNLKSVVPLTPTAIALIAMHQGQRIVAQRKALFYKVELTLIVGYTPYHLSLCIKGKKL